MKFCFDEHPAHFGALFGYCDHQVHKLMGRMLKRYDVSPMQCRTLMFLHDAEDSVNQKTLERHLMIKPSTVNGIVDRLEKLELARRERSGEDRRVIYVAATARYEQLRKKTETDVGGYFSSVMDTLTEREKDQIIAALSRLDEALLAWEATE